MKTSMVYSPGSSLSKQPGYGEYRIWNPYLGEFVYAKTKEDANRMARNAMIPQQKGTRSKIGFTQGSVDSNKSSMKIRYPNPNELGWEWDDYVKSWRKTTPITANPKYFKSLYQ